MRKYRCPPLLQASQHVPCGEHPVSLIPFHALPVVEPVKRFKLYLETNFAGWAAAD